MSLGEQLYEHWAAEVAAHRLTSTFAATPWANLTRAERSAWERVA